MMHDTPKTNWLAEAKTLDELNTLYKKLCKKYHPDMGGDLETMQEINAEYDARLPEMQQRAERGTESQQRKTATANPEQFREVLAKLARFDDLNIEMCGSWLWISGNTFPAKEALKEAGCMWASKKRMWYYREEENACRHSHGKSMEEIRMKYDSVQISNHQIRLA